MYYQFLNLMYLHMLYSMFSVVVSFHNALGSYTDGEFVQMFM